MGYQIIIITKEHPNGYSASIIDEFNKVTAIGQTKEKAIETCKKEFANQIANLAKTNEAPSKYLQDCDYVEHNIKSNIVKNIINIAMGKNHKMPNGYTIIKNLSTNEIFFVKNEEKFGPYSNRFEARNKAIEHNKNYKLKDEDLISKITADFIKKYD